MVIRQNLFNYKMVMLVFNTVHPDYLKSGKINLVLNFDYWTGYIDKKITRVEASCRFFTCNSTYNLTNRRCLGSDERPFERDWVHDAFDMGLFAGQAVIEPVGESRSDFYIFRDLCRKMGNPDLWPWETERELCDWKLEPLSIDFEKLIETCFYPAPEIWNKHEKGLLRSDKNPGYPTPSGKLELYASLLEEVGLDPLPVFSYPPECYETAPQLAKDYPYILITGSRELNFPLVLFHFYWKRQRKCSS